MELWLEERLRERVDARLASLLGEEDIDLFTVDVGGGQKAQVSRGLLSAILAGVRARLVGSPRASAPSSGKSTAFSEHSFVDHGQVSSVEDRR
jgi:hypothetical protein